MFAAFSCTCLADVSTDPAQLYCCLTTHAHYLCGGKTNGGTFHIQLNAPCHHLHLVALKATRGTMITDRCTLQTGFDTTFVLMITGHSFLV
jgi:hypothetical protein